MENKNEFIEFISPEDYRHHIEIWYKIYNISREKTELFRDFLISLYNLIDETYLGEDVMIYEEDQKNHFTWCWDKTINNFSKEKIYFKFRGNYYEYFWNFFYEAFYLTKIDQKPNKIVEYVNKLFNYNYIKTRSELDIVTELYKLLDENLKK